MFFFLESRCLSRICPSYFDFCEQLKREAKNIFSAWEKQKPSVGNADYNLGMMRMLVKGDGGREMEGKKMPIKSELDQK